MPEAIEIEAGDTVVLEDEPWRVVDTRADAPPTGVRLALRSLRTGAPATRRLAAGDLVRRLRLERRDVQYLYSHGALHHVMDVATFEQWAMDAALVREALPFLRESDTVSVEMLDGRPVCVVLPDFVDLEVAVTAPGTGGGDVVANVFKEATLETGATIRVPLSVEIGARVRVDTRTGQFLGLAG